MKRKLSWLLLMLGLFTFCTHAHSFAQSSSTNYQIYESFIGPGGALESNSTNFRTEPGQQSVGNIGVGNSSSTNFQTNTGFTTTSDPRLAFSVNTSLIDFGVLSDTAANTATATFSVLNYTSHGYIVHITGNSLTDGSNTIDALASNAASAPGTEQFGINLKDNGPTPDVGAEVAQIPDSTFSFGTAATNYNTANSFRYVSGDTIAQATKSSGQTNYTISYLVNIAGITPAGTYSTAHTLICTGTY